MNYGQVVKTIGRFLGQFAEEREREATSVLRPSLDPSLIVCFRSCYHRDCAPGEERRHTCVKWTQEQLRERCSLTEGKILRL